MAESEMKSTPASDILGAHVNLRVQDSVDVQKLDFESPQKSYLYMASDMGKTFLHGVIEGTSKVAGYNPNVVMNPNAAAMTAKQAAQAIKNAKWTFGNEPAGAQAIAAKWWSDWLTAKGQEL